MERGETPPLVFDILLPNYLSTVKVDKENAKVSTQIYSSTLHYFQTCPIL